MSHKKKIGLVSLGMLVVILLGLVVYTSHLRATAKAVYLVPRNGGQLGKNELKDNPSIVTVSSSTALKMLASNHAAIWIDKDAVDFLDKDWLQKQGDKGIPIAIIGYDNPIYLFNAWNQHLPSQTKMLTPGFGVYKVKDKSEPSFPVFQKRYNETPNAKKILMLTNLILDGKLPE